jgi:hypothetical protein
MTIGASLQKDVQNRDWQYYERSKKGSSNPLFNVESGAESEASELRFSSTPRQFGIRSEREQVL